MELLEATARRLEAARRGDDVARLLRSDALEAGSVGVLEAVVVQVQPARSFRRRNGTEGLVQRVVLQDAAGEVELVLWDEDARHVRDGTLAPARHVRLEGVTVRPGFRGGPPELGLGVARIVPLEAEGPSTTLHGALVLEATVPVAAAQGTRFKAEGTLETADGTVRVILWDDAVRQARQAIGAAPVEGPAPVETRAGRGAAEAAAARGGTPAHGAAVRVRVQLTAMAPHPALDGHYLSTPSTSVAPLPQP